MVYLRNYLYNIQNKNPQQTKMSLGILVLYVCT